MVDPTNFSGFSNQIIHDNSKHQEKEREKETKESKKKSDEHSYKQYSQRVADKNVTDTKYVEKTQEVKTTAKTQNVQKQDTMFKEDTQVRQYSTDLNAVLKGQETEKPRLPSPLSSFGAKTQQEMKEDLSIIVIIAAVMVLQAKTNSEMFRNMWQQASENMNMQMTMTKLNAENTKNNWNAQAEATKQQAQMGLTTGVTSLLMFSASAVMGGFASAKEAEKGVQEGTNTMTEDAIKNAEAEAKKAAEEAAKKTAQDAPDISQQGEEAVQQQAKTAKDISKNSVQESIKENLDKGNQSGKDAASKALDTAKNTLTKSGKVMEALKHGMQYGMWLSTANQGMNGITQYVYEGKVAASQREAGMYDSASKMAQGYSEFFGQAFSRSTSLGDSIQQNVDYSMQVYKNASDSITQAVSSMFSR